MLLRLLDHRCWLVLRLLVLPGLGCRLCLRRLWRRSTKSWYTRACIACECATHLRHGRRMRRDLLMRHLLFRIGRLVLLGTSLLGAAMLQSGSRGVHRCLRMLGRHRLLHWLLPLLRCCRCRVRFGMRRTWMCAGA